MEVNVEYAVLLARRSERYANPFTLVTLKIPSRNEYNNTPKIYPKKGSMKKMDSLAAHFAQYFTKNPK